MTIKPDRLAVYDTESTGLSAHHDQIVEFAGIAVDNDLNIIKGDQLHVKVQMRQDVVPSPQAFAITGISLEDLRKNGIPEMEAAQHIRNWFLKGNGNSMMTGFNTLSFDDEMVRNMLYRNLMDPYEHEYKNGNTRSDIFRLVMMAFALRPEMLTWPLNHEGRHSLKLGDLCRENGVSLENAHSAFDDCMATVNLMRVIKNSNPRMFEHFLQLSDKKYVKNIAEARKPVLLVDRYLPREQGHLSMVLPIIYDARTPNKMLCVDLRQDPEELLSLPASEIKRRVFTPAGDLKEGEAINCIRDITSNKQPLVFEQNVIKGRPDVLQRAGLDIDACMRHAEIISQNEDFRGRLQEAYVAEFPPCEDVYQGIYSLGLIGKDEALLRAKARTLEPAKEGRKQFPVLVNLDPHTFSKQQARDPLRIFELTLRSKWSNFGEEVLARGSFTANDLGEWIAHLDRVWFGEPKSKRSLNLDMCREAFSEVRATTALDEKQRKVLLELEAHIESNLQLLESMKAIHKLKLNPEPEPGVSGAEEPSADVAQDSSEADRIEAERKNREVRHNSTGQDFTI